MLKIDNIIIKLKNDEKLNKKDIMFLYDYLQKTNNNNKQSILLNLINNKGLGKILFEEYKHFLSINNLNKELDLINKELKIVFKPNYTLIDLNKDLQIVNNDYHKFISVYSIYDVLDKIYNSNNDLIIKGYDNLKDFITNNNNLIAFKIDLDLLKTNEHKFKSLNYCKVIIYKYDSTIIYYLMNKNDLLDLNLKYSYDYNNLLSYYLDYKFKHYYDIFNDKSKLNIAFNNLGTYNRVLVNKTKNNNDLKINKSFKYNNDYYTFNSLLNKYYEVKYLSIDINKYLKQIDLELISIDNDNDYLTLLNKVYNFFNSLFDEVDNKYQELKNDINNLICSYDKKQLKIISKTTLKKFTLINIDEVYTIKDLENLNDNISLLNNCSHDKKILIDILNQLDFIIDRYNNKIDNENYNKNYLSFEKLNKHNSKNLNNDLEQIKNGNKNYCYETNKRYFKIV